MQVDEIIEKRYGLKIRGVEFVRLKNDKVRIISKSAYHIMKKINLKVNYFGFYLGKVKKNNNFVFSLDATCLFGENIKSGIIEIDDNNKVKEWIYGKDIELNLNLENRFVVLKFLDYFLGAGYYKDGVIKNFFPKRRINI